MSASARHRGDGTVGGGALTLRRSEENDSVQSVSQTRARAKPTVPTARASRLLRAENDLIRSWGLHAPMLIARRKGGLPINLDHLETFDVRQNCSTRAVFFLDSTRKTSAKNELNILVTHDETRLSADFIPMRIQYRWHSVKGSVFRQAQASTTIKGSSRLLPVKCNKMDQRTSCLAENRDLTRSLKM